VKLGLQIPNFVAPGGPPALAANLAAVARAADQIGLASLWVMDHFFQIEHVGPLDSEMPESYTTLGFLASVTSRIRLGALVTAVTVRHPGILAKTISTLDVLSGGRAALGIGAAWSEREHVGLGVPFPPLRERFERLEEALQIVLQMWSGQVGAFAGKHYQLAETLNSPQPLTKPHPPILIGGGGERQTLRLVARYGDACNLYSAEAGTIPHKLDVLREHCRQAGRDYGAIEKTTLGWIDLGGSGTRDDPVPSVSAAELVDVLGSLAELGIQHAIFSFRNVWDLHLFDVLHRDVLPHVQA
jgi:F420-dependent oxidoreductase-like protein